jgi:hypothetical protein
VLPFNVGIRDGAVQLVLTHQRYACVPVLDRRGGIHGGEEASAALQRERGHAPQRLRALPLHQRRHQHPHCRLPQNPLLLEIRAQPGRSDKRISTPIRCLISFPSSWSQPECTSPLVRSLPPPHARCWSALACRWIGGCYLLYLLPLLLPLRLVRLLLERAQHGSHRGRGHVEAVQQRSHQPRPRRRQAAATELLRFREVACGLGRLLCATRGGWPRHFGSPRA